MNAPMAHFLEFPAIIWVKSDTCVCFFLVPWRQEIGSSRKANGASPPLPVTFHTSCDAGIG